MPDIHDSEILEINVKFREEKIDLLLISDTDKSFKVSFEEVFSYNFEEPNSYSVLYDIANIKDLTSVKATEENFKEKQKQLLNSNAFRSMQEYNDFLLSNNYSLFVIHSSVGLHGTIVAKDMIVSP